MSAADDRRAIEEQDDPNEPGMGSALIAIVVMLFATAVLSVLIYIVMLPIQSMPHHHDKARADSIAAPAESPKKVPVTPPAK